MSAVANRALGVEVTLLRRHFVVVKLAVTVEVVSGNSSKLPPDVTCTRCVLLLLGRSDATSRQYDTVRFVGTAILGTKNMVFTPLFMRGTVPCASRPRSLDSAFFHMFLSAPRMRCLYLKD